MGRRGSVGGSPEGSFFVQVLSYRMQKQKERKEIRIVRKIREELKLASTIILMHSCTIIMLRSKHKSRCTTVNIYRTKGRRSILSLL
jgi:hypothetical protein